MPDVTEPMGLEERVEAVCRARFPHWAAYPINAAYTEWRADKRLEARAALEAAQVPELLSALTDAQRRLGEAEGLLRRWQRWTRNDGGRGPESLTGDTRRFLDG